MYKRVSLRLAQIASTKCCKGIVDTRNIPYSEFCTIVYKLVSLGYTVEMLTTFEGMMLITKTNRAIKIPDNVYDIYYTLLPKDSDHISLAISLQQAAIQC